MPFIRQAYRVVVLSTFLGASVCNVEARIRRLDDLAFREAIRLVNLSGSVKERARICRAPAWAYESTLKEAETLLPRAYKDAGMSSGQASLAEANVQKIQAEIGGSAEICDGFRRIVSVLGRQVDLMSGRRLRAKQLYDTPDWREHPDRPPRVPAPGLG
jgi:hypothetical protein